MVWLLLALVGLVYLAVGPWTIPAVLLLLAVPRLRRWVLARLPRPRRPWRAVLVGTVVVVLLGGALWVVPDGTLPAPTAGGLLVTPDYEGRQVSARPLDAEPPPQHPWLAPSGRTSGHTDAWNSGSTVGPGPLGDAPEVDTAWYGRERCGDLAWDSHGRLVAVCQEGGERTVRVIDPDTLRQVASKRLSSGSGCDSGPDADFFLDNGDRAVVTTTDRRIQALSTFDAEGKPDITVVGSWNLSKVMEEDDCLVAVFPDWSGRLWWSTRAGRVGVLDTVEGGAEVTDLEEPVSTALASDEDGVYVVTDAAVYRLGIGRKGAPAVVWRSEYDRGVERKSGQRVRGSGGGVTLLDDGLLAFTDNAEPRLGVVLLDRSTGDQVCSAAVFDGGESASDVGLVSLGSGVVVTNTHGYDGPRDTLLGFATTPGMARVDPVDGDCEVRWTNTDVVVPDSAPKASWETGLVYAWTKRPTLWGVSSWYLSAVDAGTGEHVFSVRAGTGAWHASGGSDLLLAPDGSVLVGTASGLVRIRDRVRDN